MSNNNVLILTFSQAYNNNLTIAGISFTLSNNGLTLTSINQNITSIPNAFMSSIYDASNIVLDNLVQSNLVSVVIPDTVSLIGISAFDSCQNLSSVTFGNSLTTISDYAFYNCYLNSVSFPNSLTYIGDGAFFWALNCTSVTIGTNVTHIGNQAFSNNDELQIITMPNTVTTLGTSAFSQCMAVTSVTLSSSLTSIPESLFVDCTVLPTVVIPPSVTSISSNAFESCRALTDIIIPTTVTTLGEAVFTDCNNLTQVTVGPSVTSIGNNVFEQCIALNTVNFADPTVITNVGTNLFIGAPSTVQVNTYSTSDINIISSNLQTQITNLATDPAPLIISNYISVLSSIYKLDNSPTFNLNASSPNSNVITYVTSNPSIASVDSIGNVTIHRTGRVTITLTQDSLNNYLGNFASDNTIVTIRITSSIVTNICFLGNTPIKTDQGEIAIANLKSGVHTIEGKAIKRITQTVTDHKYLVCIEKDALSKNVPSQKTIISANHQILYKGHMVKAKDLIGVVDNVFKTKYRGEYLYNVLLETHETMSVNNMICETLNPNNEIVKLYDILDKIPLEYHDDIISKCNSIKSNKVKGL